MVERKTLLILVLSLCAASGYAQTLNGRWATRRTADRDWSDVVIGGRDADGSPLRVCHGLYNGALLPGKVVSDQCNVAWEGEEVTLSSFEVLVGNNDERLWGPPHLDGAAEFVGGEAVNGHEIRVCRAKFYRDSQYLGTHPGRVVQNSCAITFGGREYRRDDYQVLYASLRPAVTSGSAPDYTIGGISLSVNHLTCVALASAALTGNGFNENSGTSGTLIYSHRGHFSAGIECFEHPNFATIVVAGPRGTQAEAHDLWNQIDAAFKKGLEQVGQ